MESMEAYQDVVRSKQDELIINCPQCQNESRIQFSPRPVAMSCGCDYRETFSDDQLDKTRQSIEILKKTLGNLAA